MTEIGGSTPEQQRFEHLVLGRPRPTAEGLKKPRGMPRSEWRQRRVELRKAATVLAPGVEEWVALREAWRGLAGTPETLERADRARRRAGSMARLFNTGAITRDQLAAAQQIAETYEAIGAAVSVRTASWETRTDGGFRPENAGAEITYGAMLELAYGRWRAKVDGPVSLVLAIVVDDIGLKAAARQHRMRDERAKAVLTGALDLWWKVLRER